MGSWQNTRQPLLPATRSVGRSAEERLLAQPRRRIVWGLAAPTAALAALGALQRLDAAPALFDFDGEGKPLALWSALVLAIAATVAFLLSRRDDRPVAWRVLGAFFAYMALDEAAALHEHLETDLHVDWQLGLAPLALAGAIAFVLVLKRVWELEGPRLLLLAGASAWVISQIDENYQSS